MHTMTANRRPIHPMAPGHNNTYLRSTLRDQAAWDDQTSTEYGRDEVERWLKLTITNIEQQLAARNPIIEALQRPDLWRRSPELAEQLAWRKGAVHVKRLCELRLAELKRLRSNNEAQLKAMKALLLQLVDLVLDREEGLIDDDELYDALDELTLPGDDAPTLREYAESCDDDIEPDNDETGETDEDEVLAPAL